MMDFFNKISIEPVQLVWGIVAVCGGIARYLNSFTTGAVRFKFSILLASAFVSGFSGYMFALLGQSMNLPTAILFVMAGTGGFFGEQSMKLLIEYFGERINTPQ